jgi:hypothetical protein
MERRPDIECVLAYEEKAGGGFALCQIDAPNKDTKASKGSNRGDQVACS